MKREYWIITGVLLLGLYMFTGCVQKDREELLLVPVSDEIPEEMLQNEAAGEDVYAGADAVLEKALDGADAAREEALGRAGVATENGEVQGKLVVHICGAVKAPGVYTLVAGSRLYQAVEAAGGFSENAGEEYLNLANLLSDGEKIYVPTREEAEEQSLSKEGAFHELTKEVDDGLVNLNTATAELLCSLPGIGEGKAESIITYREANGSFKSIEDIMKVEGIKEGLFQKIKDKITV